MSVSATASEQASAKATTTASVWNSWPASSRANSMGMKIASVVSVLAMIAPATSSVPATAEASRSSPNSLRRRWMFSSTTIAESTIMPTPSASPPRVIRFRV